MARRLFGSLLSAALLGLSASQSLAASLRVALEDADNRPVEYLDETGRLTGFHVELVRQVCDTLGWQVGFERVPWQRAEALLESGAVDAVTFMARNPQREAYAWFLPDNVLGRTSVELWVLQDRAASIRWEPPLAKTMAHWRVGGVLGWYYGDEYKAAIVAGAPVDLTATSVTALARMLLAGRIDIALAETRFPDQIAAELPGVAGRLHSLPGASLPGTPVYLAFTRRGAGEAEARQFASAYADWRRTGAYRTLVERFGVADRVAASGDAQGRNGE